MGPFGKPGCVQCSDCRPEAALREGGSGSGVEREGLDSASRPQTIASNQSQKWREVFPSCTECGKWHKGDCGLVPREFQAMALRFCGSQEQTLFCKGEAHQDRKGDSWKVTLLVSDKWGLNSDLLVSVPFLSLKLSNNKIVLSHCGLNWNLRVRARCRKGNEINDSWMEKTKQFRKPKQFV